MKCLEIMKHFYAASYERYNKQNFELDVMGSTILGFDIRPFASKFDFTKPFTVNMEEIVQGDDEKEEVYHYHPIAILTKRKTGKGSSLFFLNKEKTIYLTCI